MSCELLEGNPAPTDHHALGSRSAAFKMVSSINNHEAGKSPDLQQVLIKTGTLEAIDPMSTGTRGMPRPAIPGTKKSGPLTTRAAIPATFYIMWGYSFGHTPEPRRPPPNPAL